MGTSGRLLGILQLGAWFPREAICCRGDERLTRRRECGVYVVGAARFRVCVQRNVSCRVRVSEDDIPFSASRAAKEQLYSLRRIQSAREKRQSTDGDSTYVVR
jgi:hypothetical protein